MTKNRLNLPDLDLDKKVTMMRYLANYAGSQTIRVSRKDIRKKKAEGFFIINV